MVLLNFSRNKSFLLIDFWSVPLQAATLKVHSAEFTKSPISRERLEIADEEKKVLPKSLPNCLMDNLLNERICQDDMLHNPITREARV